jgi:adenine-specific DNA glycosylase
MDNMLLQLHDIETFQQMIWDWWKTNRRDLPWRHTRVPYRILISEMMLQQTQVSRVFLKYPEFIEKYPDIQSLTIAKTSDVIKIWKGMGYNRRALYLKKCAQIIVSDYDGLFPQTEYKLTQLPGLGIYTARALLVFAFDKQLAFVDTNIRKIITHYFFADITPKPAEVQDVANQLLPKNKAWDWHQALMDYGSIELPKLIPKIISKNPIYKPFRTTDRFFRGRIIDELRLKSFTETNLLKHCQINYELDLKKGKSLLNALETEGLINRAPNGIISLSE